MSQGPDALLAAADAALPMDAIRGVGACTAGPVHGSLATLITALLADSGPVLLVTGHLDEADEALAMLADLGLDAARFAAVEAMPGKLGQSSDLIAERLALLDRLGSDDAPTIVVTPIVALMQSVPAPGRLNDCVRRLCGGDSAPMGDLVCWLSDAGYQRREAIDDSGQFAVRGGILDIATAAGECVRLDYDGDRIESIREVDPVSMGSDRVLDEVAISTMVPPAGEATLTAHLGPTWRAVLDDLEEVTAQARSYIDRVASDEGLVHGQDVMAELVSSLRGVLQLMAPPAATVDIPLPVTALSPFSTEAAEALKELADLATDRPMLLACRTGGEATRMQEVLGKRPGLTIEERFVHRGFLLEGGLAVVAAHEVLHRYEVRRPLRRGGRSLRESLAEFDVDDLVVHREHGIARYLGLGALDGRDGEYMTLQFSGKRRLHVPATHAHLIDRYVGSPGGRPQLSALGGTRWSIQKEKAAGSARELAAAMLRLQALREASPGIASPPDTPWMAEFEASFPWDETADQVTAIAAVKKDMERPRPMDRLICGDVGFGKTEVAIRAAFKAAEGGRQVAVLVPTTVLAAQHALTFARRLADYPFSVAALTRFQTGSEQREILRQLAEGGVDVIIGTHRLLSSDVSFSDLGLVVVDEEQRFGVEHKQRLLALRAQADVLTMTATPIPRTLHMALLGLRDISSLQEAPQDRRAIITEVTAWEDQRIARGIRRELAREGQVFFVHNRVKDIEDVAASISALVPEARIVVGHGQMGPRELERVMLTFVDGKADVLVSTTIIESGIDIPAANTMFIADADRFGLADLHQLRGRVGRWRHRAFCTLLLPRDRTVNPVARRRLAAIEQFSMLGAGFRIALRDLEIRGAGNLLGPQQSGHIAAVGYELYCQLLAAAVADLQEGGATQRPSTTIDLGACGSIPIAWIASATRRLGVYRRLAAAASEEALESVVTDIESAWGPLPAAAAELVTFHALRIGAAHLGIDSMVPHEGDLVIRCSDPAAVEAALGSLGGTIRQVGKAATAGLMALYLRPPPELAKPKALLAALRASIPGSAVQENRAGRPMKREPAGFQHEQQDR